MHGQCLQQDSLPCLRLRRHHFVIVIWGLMCIGDVKHYQDVRTRRSPLLEVDVTSLSLRNTLLSDGAQMLLKPERAAAKRL